MGGRVGSGTLASPAESTWPPADRIRESIFRSLESKGALGGSKVLDLYAGTGALGLEALSRGAVTAVLVESNKMAAAVCIKNARTVQDALSDEGQEVSAKVQIQPVQKFLESTAGSFDLVFIDPPYDLTNQEIEKCLESLRLLVSEKAWVLVERSSRVDAFATTGYGLVDTKPFGDTVVYWLKPA